MPTHLDRLSNHMAKTPHALAWGVSISIYKHEPILISQFSIAGRAEQSLSSQCT